MSIASRITQIEEHINNIYDTLETAGEDLTNVNKNIVNINASLINRLKDYLASGIEVVWNNWEKIEEEGSTLYLSNTIVGNMKFSYKGNTTQSGTPTPTAPQPINVVSGRQDVVVCGKNLLPNDIESQTINGLTITKNEDGSLLINGTSNATTRLILGENIPLSAGTYTVSIHKEGTVNNSCYMSTLTQGTTTEVSGSSLNMYNANSKSYTLNSSTIVYMQLYIGGSRTFTNFKIYPMLEKGSQPSTYEAYKGNTYEINLGKNLLEAKEGTYTRSTTHTWNVSNDNILVSVNDANVQGGSLNINTGQVGVWGGTYKSDNHITSNGGTYTLSIEATGNINLGRTTGFLGLYYHIYNDDGTTAQTEVKFTANATTTKTITLNSNQHLGSIVLYSQYISCENVELKIQVEKGTEETSFSPYKTPIELCKIGNYQDKIYKNGNKWYLEKKIGKTVITNDNKNIITAYGTNANHKKIDINKTDLGWQSNNTTGIALINKYKEVSSFANVNTGCFGCNFNASVVRIWNDDFTDLTNAQNTLIGTEIYIAQATPTTTEITDTELISQLESIENTKSFDGQTNIMVSSSDLQIIMSITALKDIT